MFALLVLLAGASSLYAQRPGVTGKVIDRSTRRPVIDASVSLGSIRVSTDHKGEFEIWTSLHQQDTLSVASLTHDSVVTIVRPGDNVRSLTIELPPRSVVLEDVRIVVSPGYKADSLITREQFAKIFNYDAPRVIEAFSLTSINVAMLYEALSKEKKLKVRLQNRLREDEEYKMSQQRYSKRLVAQLTRLEGEELDRFYFDNEPPVDFTLEANDYDLIQYIKRRYEEYKNTK
jgi:hypothetical protein